MRVVALIYLVLAGVNLLLWLTDGTQKEFSLTAGSTLTWGLYFLSLLSVLAVVVRLLLLPKQLWQLVFLVYCSTRLYELATRGLTLSGENLAADINVLGLYLFMVIPPAVAMFYLGFIYAGFRWSTNQRRRKDRRKQVDRRQGAQDSYIELAPSTNRPPSQIFPQPPVAKLADDAMVTSETTSDYYQ